MVKLRSLYTCFFYCLYQIHDLLLQCNQIILKMKFIEINRSGRSRLVDYTLPSAEALTLHNFYSFTDSAYYKHNISKKNLHFFSVADRKKKILYSLKQIDHSKQKK